MKRAKLVGISLPMLALAGCQTTPDTRTIAMAQLRSADGGRVGSAAFVETGGMVTVKVTASGIAPGDHGLHLHMTGNCTAPDFKSAGGHLNPHGKQHGSANPGGAHLGDLPNLTADAKGDAALSVALQGNIDELSGYMFDADGTAIVIHESADDMVSDPAGNAGKRIACGVLIKG